MRAVACTLAVLVLLAGCSTPAPSTGTSAEDTATASGAGPTGTGGTTAAPTGQPGGTTSTSASGTPSSGPTSASASPSPTSTATGGPTTAPGCPECADRLTLRIVTDADVYVPYPHGTWCLDSSDWVAARTAGVTSERSTDRGWTLEVASAGFEGTVWAKDQTTCNTLRYDPWSIEPDPPEDALDVFANAGGTLRVEVESVAGACTARSVYEGQVTSDWVRIPRTVSTGCA